MGGPGREGQAISLLRADLIRNHMANGAGRHRCVHSIKGAPSGFRVSVWMGDGSLVGSFTRSLGSGEPWVGRNNDLTTA